MSGSEATIKFKTIADLAGLQSFIDGINTAKGAIDGVQASAGSTGGGGGKSAHHHVSAGSAPPSPAGPEQGHGSAPPPAPVSTPTGPVPAHHLPGGDTTAAGQGFGGAPPPPAPPQLSMPDMGAASRRSRDPSSFGQLGAPPPPPEAPPPISEPPDASVSGPAQQGGAGPPGRRAGRLDGAKRQASTFLSTAAGTAVGLGLGSSVSGFILSSGQKYMELSRVITHLNRRFREAGEGAAFMGQEMGYTIAQTSGMVEAMGEQSNVVSRGAFRQQVGFARNFGMDPTQALRGFGTIERLQEGRRLSVGEFAEFAGTAQGLGMDKGRMGEQHSAAVEMSQQMFRETGRADLSSVLTMQRMASQVFSGGEAGRGSMGADFMGRLGGVMKQSGPMKTFMMRAMGYGSEGSDMGYIEMRKRLEEGVTNPENIIDLFSSFQGRGLSKEGQFKALESVSGGQLKAHEMEALVNTLGTEEGLVRFGDDSLFGRDRSVASFTASLTDQERATFAEQGMFGLGTMGGRVSMGEGRAVQLESMQMQVGRPVAKAMVDLTATAQNIMGLLSNLMGQDLGGVLTDLTGVIRDVSGMMKGASEGYKGPFSTQTAGQQLRHTVDVGRMEGGGRALQLALASNYGHWGRMTGMDLIPESTLTSTQKQALKMQGFGDQLGTTAGQGE